MTVPCLSRSLALIAFALFLVVMIFLAVMLFLVFMVILLVRVLCVCGIFVCLWYY